MTNITRSNTKSRMLGGEVPSQLATIELEETCVLCLKDLQEGVKCYRHNGTNRIICTNCAVDIAVAR